MMQAIFHYLQNTPQIVNKNWLLKIFDDTLTATVKECPSTFHNLN